MKMKRVTGSFKRSSTFSYRCGCPHGTCADQGVVVLLLSSSVDRLLNAAWSRESPRALAPPIRATEMRAAIRPYSMAVAPDLVLQEASEDLGHGNFSLTQGFGSARPTTVCRCSDDSATYTGPIAGCLRKWVTIALTRLPEYVGKQRDNIAAKMRAITHSYIAPILRASITVPALRSSLPKGRSRAAFGATGRKLRALKSSFTIRVHLLGDLSSGHCR